MKPTNTAKPTVRSLAATINAFEAGTLSGPGAEQEAAEAVAILERCGISPAEVCRKYA